MDDTMTCAACGGTNIQGGVCADCGAPVASNEGEGSNMEPSQPGEEGAANESETSM